MAVDQFEIPESGHLKDRYGRRQMVAVEKHTTPATTDKPQGDSFTDGDGREQVVITLPSGASLPSVGSDLAVVKEGALNPAYPEYGAVVDGSTDDSAAYQDVLDVIDGAGGGRLLVPPGVSIVKNLQISPGTEVFGAGLGTSILKLAPSAPVAADLPGGDVGASIRFLITNRHGGSTGDSGLSIHDLTLDGNVANGNAVNEFYFGIGLYSVQDVTIRNVKCQDLRGDGIYINWNGTVESEDVHINDVILDNVGVDAGVGAGRQGVSIVQCKRFTVRNVTGKVVGGFLVDVEPNNTTDICEQFTIDGVHGYDCVGGVNVIEQSGGATRYGKIDNVTVLDGPSQAFTWVVQIAGADSIDVGRNIHSDVLPSVGRRIFLLDANYPTNLTVDATKVEAKARAAALVVLPDSRIVDITSGAGAITSIFRTWPGHTITLRLISAVTLTDGSNLKLVGNFADASLKNISLVCDGTDWWETARAVTA